MTKTKAAAPIPVERITQSIQILRGHKVLLDVDLAAMYGVETKALLQAVKRNLGRLPEDFMLQLSADEWTALRSQNCDLKRRSRWPPVCVYAFTEQGVAMLFAVRNSERAITVNIEIMRELLASNKELAQQLKKLEHQSLLARRDHRRHPQNHPPTHEPARTQEALYRIHRVGGEEAVLTRNARSLAPAPAPVTDN